MPLRTAVDYEDRRVRPAGCRAPPPGRGCFPPTGREYRTPPGAGSPGGSSTAPVAARPSRPIERISGGVDESLHWYQTSPSGRAAASEIVPGLGRQLDQALRIQLQPIEAGSAGVLVAQQDGRAVGIPRRLDVTRQIDRERARLTGRRPPDQRSLQVVALMQHEDPLVARDERKASRVQTQPGTVRQLADELPVRVHDAQLRVARVAVLGVMDADQPLVVRRVRRPTPPRRARRSAAAARPHAERGSSSRRPSTGRPRPSNDRCSGRRRTRGPSSGRRLVRLAAAEGLDHPATELIAVGVVEPPDPARRTDRARPGSCPPSDRSPGGVRRTPCPTRRAPTCRDGSSRRAVDRARRRPIREESCAVREIGAAMVLQPYR